MKHVITDQPTPPNNSQNATANQQKQEVTLVLRKYILLLASLVATVTYHVARFSPRDVWQDTATGHLAGDHPIIRDTHHRRHVAFFYCNATAFAASLLVIVLTLILAYLDDKQQEKKHRITLRTLQAAMVLSLLSLMGAYTAGTCWDTFTTTYSSLMVGFVLAYLVIQMAAASCFTGGSVGVHGMALASVPANNANSGSAEVTNEVEEEEPFRKTTQMLLATFAVSVTYLAGLSTPASSWDATGADAGHGPDDDAIVMDRHNTCLAVFFVFKTTAFVASLLNNIVVLLDTKLRKINAYGFMAVALFSLIVAYSAGGRCRREADTAVYVFRFSLIPAALLYISFLWWRLSPRDKEKAASKARSLLLLFVAMVVTITYQRGLDPPGGVWQANSYGHSHRRSGDLNPNKSKRKRPKNGSARS